MSCSDDKDVIHKRDMNLLILDFFRISGMKDCFHAFCEETQQTKSVEDSLLLDERNLIQKHILSGEIRAATSVINDLDSNILRNDTELAFSLQKQALLELLKKKVSPVEALKFAQIQLVPLVKTDNRFLHDVETLISLLLFNNIEESPDKHLLEDSYRKYTANIVNRSLLRAYQAFEQPKLCTLMKMTNWAQNECTHTHQITIPIVSDFCNANIDSSEYDLDDLELNRSEWNIE